MAPTEVVSSDRYFEFEVFGIPQTKGSTRYFRKGGVKSGRVVIVNANPKNRAWERSVRSAATFVMLGVPLWVGPVQLIMDFYLPKQKNIKLHKPFHTKPPDLDKLVRSIMDALTGVVYENDSQVVRHQAWKQYGDIPKVKIGVSLMRG